MASLSSIRECLHCKTQKKETAFPCSHDGTRVPGICVKCLHELLEGVGVSTKAGPTLSLECDVCSEDKPPWEFPLNFGNTYEGPLALPPLQEHYKLPRTIPDRCRRHLALGPAASRPICNDCITRHVYTCMHFDGAQSITCIDSDCDPDPGDLLGWPQYALFWLPRGWHDKWEKQLFDYYWKPKKKWECPDDKCDCKGMYLEPNKTRGYPRIECYGCKEQFCADCRVRWHKGMTCPEYRSKHPEVVGDEKTWRMLATAGAKQCPVCELPIIKAEGGCNSVQCENCKRIFDWSKAAMVLPPGEEGILKEAEDSGSDGHTDSQLRRLREEEDCEMEISGVDPERNVPPWKVQLAALGRAQLSQTPPTSSPPPLLHETSPTSSAPSSPPPTPPPPPPDPREAT